MKRTSCNEMAYRSSCDCRSAVQVDDRQLLVLLSQLRLNSPQAKPQLQRVIYNLGQHHGTLRAVLRLALALLRFPLSPDEAEPASEEEQSRAPRSLRDALQVSMLVYIVRMTSSHLHALPLCLEASSHSVPCMVTRPAFPGKSGSCGPWKPAASLSFWRHLLFLCHVTSC